MFKKSVICKSAVSERSLFFVLLTTRYFRLSNWTNLSSILFFFLFFSGSWWNLSKVPDDLWRLCKEKDTQRKGMPDICFKWFFIILLDWSHLLSFRVYSLQSILYIISFFHFFVLFCSMWTILSSAVNLKHHADFMLLAAIRL